MKKIILIALLIFGVIFSIRQYIMAEKYSDDGTRLLFDATSMKKLGDGNYGNVYSDSEKSEMILKAIEKLNLAIKYFPFKYDYYKWSGSA